MSKTTDKLIDDIIELVLEDVDCHHEQDHDEDGVHATAEYSLNDETKIRGKIGALLKPEVTEKWIEEKAEELLKLIKRITKEHEIELDPISAIAGRCGYKDFIRSLVKEIVDK